MKIKVCRPCRLPIKELDWGRLTPWIDRARDALARLDKALQQESANTRFLQSILQQEARASAHLEKAEAHSIKEALDTALHWKKQRKLGNKFFCMVHAIVRQDKANKKNIGKIRTRQNWIGPQGCKIEDAYFYPPKVAQLRPLMRSLERYIASKDRDPLVQVAIAFAQLLIIHPFMDGNGRVARIFIPIYAMRKKLTHYPTLLLSAYFRSKRLDYLRKLFKISEKQAWEEWIIFFLKGVIQQSTKLRKSL